MRGLLADVNLQGHLRFLRARLIGLGLADLLGDPEFAVFPAVGLADDLDDRSVWRFCQSEGWVLWTDNRNDDGPDSLEATLRDLWKPGDLPILTVASKPRFEQDRIYADRVAEGVAEYLFGIRQEGKYRDRPRAFLPT